MRQSPIARRARTSVSRPLRPGDSGNSGDERPRHAAGCRERGKARISWQAGPTRAERAGSRTLEPRAGVAYAEAPWASSYAATRSTGGRRPGGQDQDLSVLGTVEAGEQGEPAEHTQHAKYANRSVTSTESARRHGSRAAGSRTCPSLIARKRAGQRLLQSYRHRTDTMTSSSEARQEIFKRITRWPRTYATPINCATY